MDRVVWGGGGGGGGGGTLGTRYQQGWPRRVMLLSIMSSATRKNAWSCGQQTPAERRPRQPEASASVCIPSEAASAAAPRPSAAKQIELLELPQRRAQGRSRPERTLAVSLIESV